MGYTIRIGEAVQETDREERSTTWSTEPVDGADIGAPLDPTGWDAHWNETLPSYIGWGEAMATLGLRDVWYGDVPNGTWLAPSGTEYTALLARHPGCQPLTADHLLAFEAAERRWLDGGCVWMRYSSAGSIDRYVPSNVPMSAEAREYMGIRARWLVWWSRWALANCRYPSVSNS